MNRSALIAVVLDRSGSMNSIKEDVVGGLDRFIADQRKEPGSCSITLAQFDTEYEVVWSGRDVKDVPSASTFYVPRGGTALLDAVGRTINEVGAELAKRPEGERPSAVIFCIVTDGHENASKEFTKAQVRQMIEHQTAKYQWSFTYLGANQDSFKEAGAIGIAARATMDFAASDAGVRGSFASLSSASARRRAGETLAYAPAERSAAKGEGEKP